MTEQTTSAAPADTETLEPGVIVVQGEKFMRDAGGRLVPLDQVKPMDKLIDQTVRKMMGHADTLSAQVGRFKAHSFNDVAALQALVGEQYGAKLGGAKGNVTLTSIDGTLKVQVQIQDQIAFGPELQAAKALVDECIADWATGTRSEIRALVEHAFQVDKEGQINRGALYQLRRVAIEDPRWVRAMEAIADSVRVIGSSPYMRFYRRENHRAGWEPVTIDMAAA
ncbi:DUF3164 family protein [Methylopila sp. M107]|uniref:DUF3164 family protein n=1 Tax=Methylopila sp. M107 TaxID=1101190 RepID=UPI00037ACBED|nr:DUF3164 family protein [Methylopila sp. M107]